MVRISPLFQTFLILFISFYVSTVRSDVYVDITIEQPQHHYATITINFDEFTTKQAQFHLPIWRTGRYEVINLANGIREFSALDSQGNKLEWQL